MDEPFPEYAPDVIRPFHTGITDPRWIVGGFIAAIVIGLIGLLYGFLWAIGGILICAIFETAPRETPFLKLAFVLAVALNSLTFGVPFLMFVLGFGHPSVAVAAALTLSLFMPILMIWYANAVLEGKGWRKWLRIAAVFGATVFGIAVAKYIHVLLLDDDGLEEYLLRFALIVIPLSGWGMIAFFQRKTWRASTFTHYKFVILISLTFAITEFKAYDYLTWGFRKALPFNTWDVREWIWQDGFLPDHIYCLKAKMSWEDFLEYVGEYGLEPLPLRHEDDQDFLHRPGLSGPFEKVDWWNPSWSEDSTYFYQPRKDYTLAANYQRGYMYLTADEW